VAEHERASAAVFCVSCGLRLGEAWAFCPRCGAAHETIVESVNETEDPLLIEAQSLVQRGELKEAESRVKAMLTSGPDVQALLLLAAIRHQQNDFDGLAETLDEAINFNPTDPYVRLRRAEHFARLGLYPQAFADLRVARRYFLGGNTQAALYCQDLDRWLRDRSRSSFVRQPVLPHMPAWLSSLGRRRGHNFPAADAP
jgi:hypothetical protein